MICYFFLFLVVYFVYFVVFIAIFADGISAHEISPDILRPETFNLSINSPLTRVSIQ